MAGPNTESFAGVVSSLLDSWSRFARFLLLITTVFALLCSFVWVVVRALPRETSQVSIGPRGFLVVRTSREGSDYLVVIDPQGWQETGIQVAEGDRVDFEAGGRVQIDLQPLNHSIEERREISDRIYAQRHLNPWKDDSWAELYYTVQDNDKSKLPFEWNDPMGVTNAPIIPHRRKQLLMPDRNAGALLGAIRETQAKPARSDAFFVGTGFSFTASGLCAQLVCQA